MTTESNQPTAPATAATSPATPAASADAASAARAARKAAALPPAALPPAATLARSRAELAAALSTDTAPRAVVMTMGALHQGHFDLVAEAARRVGDQGTVVVTIFVNPLQFAAGEDLEAYPRTLEADVAGLTATLTAPDGALRVGRLVVFAPTPEVMYPDGDPAVRIDPGPIATVLEGKTRPTHFGGVCQVVLSLMHLTSPQWALFGRKDAQQLAIVRAMVRDLSVPLEIVPVEIRRERDGLAMSSRNAYLSATERQQALALSQALAVGLEAAAKGADAVAVRAAALKHLQAAPGVEVDYVALVDPDSFVDLAGAGLGLPADAAAPVPAVGLLALAAKVGKTRLIDNAIVKLS
ncbi:Pantothenate synthetase [Actinomyces bovis]|uniref:Pantothenate synthetase n=1 Tax=Actinomyces bovis TaxID=1658 RepID=A0ABY1VPL9_9ACTO|nr:pantoate--beta-alanine ligase [Actinomyces bovis]SPT53008.1 Pantothenate synthetase [Actinomyces bovis]VEG55256.1 Pantothenate synthetase [Actinomyces israelii]